MGEVFGGAGVVAVLVELAGFAGQSIFFTEGVVSFDGHDFLFDGPGQLIFFPVFVYIQQFHNRVVASVMPTDRVAVREHPCVTSPGTAPAVTDMFRDMVCFLFVEDYQLRAHSAESDPTVHIFDVHLVDGFDGFYKIFAEKRRSRYAFALRGLSLELEVATGVHGGLCLLYGVFILEGALRRPGVEKLSIEVLELVESSGV